MDAEKKLTMEEAADKGLLSQDVAEEKREQLMQLFPEVFTDGQIDFEQLRRVMGDWVEPGKERYGLNWPGKADCMKVIQAPSIATLKPARDESVDFDDTENLFIEGDNLEVLKLLQKAYFGKVKMIYIDPPYNTGKEFIYPDKYQENLDTYLAYTGQVDDEGKKFSTNTDAGGRFHANWLNMMYPRLYLARTLLREDGVIFISIDDNEQDNLRKLCDLVFGRENFIAQNVWQKRYSRENRGIIGDAHEYVLVYAKNFLSFKEVSNLVSITEAQKKAYSHVDKDKGPWRAIPMTAQGYRPNQMYEVRSPSGKTFPPPEGRCWSMIESEFLKLDQKKKIYWGKNGDSQPGVIRYLSEVKGVTPWTWWPHEETGHTDEARKEIKDIFGSTAIFDTPKPVRLINRMLEIAADNGDIVLDFFAGSCALAQAVLQRNKTENLKNKFICIQLPEHCDENSDAYKAGFKTVADIGKARIRHSANQIKDEIEGELDLNGQQKIDLGFKVFKLANSNFALWDGDVEKAEDLAKQLELHVDHIDQASGSEDILYELLLKAGFELTTKVEKRTMAGKDVYAVADGGLLICLDKEITSELIDALADADPLQVICLDEGFKGNDQLKTNAVQTFKSRAKEDEEAIVFRTV